MKAYSNSTPINQKSYFKSGLTNNIQQDTSQLITNFINVQAVQQQTQLYNPNCLKYQYKAILEGVTFDVVAPCILLEDTKSEKLDVEE